MQLVFLPAARQELVDVAQRYVMEAGLSVAERFYEHVDTALRGLCRMPGIGTPYANGVRLWPLKTFPYTLVYREDGDILTVLALAHQRRAPGYWVGR